MAKITTTKTHTSGIALGGIGSGSVELLPDGEFHFWQIANPPRLTKICFEEKADDGEGSTGALSFWVRTQKADGRPIVRKLGMKTDADDFTYRMFAWNKPVERIDFDGRFPACDLDYIDSALPCKVSLRAASPFVPHSSDLSSTPGFYLDFTLDNPTDSAVEVSLLGALEPNFANREEGRKNSFFSFEDTYGIFMKPEVNSDSPSCGSLCLSLTSDGEKSYITGDFGRYLREYVGDSDFGVTQESFLFDFREKGRLPDSDIGKKPTAIDENLKELKDSEIDSLFDTYIKYPFAFSLLERIKHIYPAFAESRAEKEMFLKCCREQTERMGDDFGSCALCSKVNLAPGEKKTIRFVLSWFFPNLFSESGKRLGHYYENLFGDASEVNKFLVKNRRNIFDRAVAFSELIYNTDMPTVYSDAWSAHLSPLVKSSRYLKDGKFGLWEGLGYCGFHTTDITYHASFSLLALFPDLQKRQMKMGAEFQREDGRVHHLFTPDLEHVDDSFDRVDMNMQFVLMVLRDYLFTGDSEYLSSLWQNVIRAMDSIESLDTDGDGLPDRDTKRNTYDSWNFSGTPVYISVLWLAALKAAAVIAERMGDPSRKEKWNELLEKGKASLQKLWNGEYYNLWQNENEADEALMSDQLDGEWFLRMLGMEGNLPDSKVQNVLKVIFDKNFDEEAGLINAACPENRKTTIFTYKNCQAGAVWTGIGYAFAALALSVGLRDIADREMHSIHNNQMRLGAFWDHWECGHHYTRPMSSWTTLIAALGLYVNREEKTIRLNPVKENITLPLCLCDVLATVTFNEGKCTVKCIEGNLKDWKIILPDGMTFQEV